MQRLSTIPVAGDLAGLALTSYAFVLGRQLGVPAQKMTPAVRLAFVDMVVGVVPGLGTVLDIFIRPSRRTLGIVHEHLQDAIRHHRYHTYGSTIFASVIRRQAAAKSVLAQSCWSLGCICTSLIY